MKKINEYLRANGALQEISASPYFSGKTPEIKEIEVTDRNAVISFISGKATVIFRVFGDFFKKRENHQKLTPLQNYLQSGKSFHSAKKTVARMITYKGKFSFKSKINQ